VWPIAAAFFTLALSSIGLSQQGGAGAVVGQALVPCEAEGWNHIGIDAAAGLGDLDGDLVLDFVARDGSLNNAVVVVRLTSDGFPKAEQQISASLGGFGGMLQLLDEFGDAVTGPGDIDIDGVPDLVVGAPGDADGGSPRGAVWVIFLNPNGTVKNEQLISATSGGFTGGIRPLDEFGRSVAAIGDLDGDSVPDIAVGAPRADPAASILEEHGAVHILFLTTAGTVKSSVRISDGPGVLPVALDDYTYFGSSVACLGDLDDDGVPDLAVGATELAPGDGEGQVWTLLMRNDGTVKQAVQIAQGMGGFTGNTDPWDYFGNSLSAPGDIDLDGVEDLVVGAPNDDDGGVDTGALWVLFLKTDGTVRSHQKITLVEGGFNDYSSVPGTSMGAGLGTLGDLDGDGKNELLATSQIDVATSFNYVVFLLTLDDGISPIVLPYGSAVNPEGSLTLLAGEPALGTSLQVGVDNPLGTQASGAKTLVVLSLAPDPLFPAGTLFPGLGMSGPGSDGELLISLVTGDAIPPALLGPAWAGPGVPSAIDISVPADPSLLQLHVFCQGIVIDPTATFGVQFGLTRALDIRIGP
jgi:hypothetical protein